MAKVSSFRDRLRPWIARQAQQPKQALLIAGSGHGDGAKMDIVCFTLQGMQDPTEVWLLGV